RSRALPAAVDEVHPARVRRSAVAGRWVGRRRALRLRAVSSGEARGGHGGQQSLGHGTRDARHGARSARAVTEVRRAHGVRGVGMTRMRRAAIGVVLVMVLLASVVTPAVGAKLAGEKVRLGVIMPQAGIFVDWGQHGIIGAEIARDEINSAGGIGGLPLELVTVDDRGDPKESVTLTRRLAQTDRVLMIHGSISSSSAGVMYPLSASLKVPIVSPTAAAPGLTDKFRPWAYTMNPGAARALGTGLAALRKHPRRSRRPPCPITKPTRSPRPRRPW